MTKLAANNNTILTLILGFACLAIIFFVIVPSLQDILKLSNEIQTQREALEDMYQRGQNLKKTHEQFDQIQTETSKIKDLLLKKGEELNFITSLEEVASQNNVIQNIQLDTNNINHQNGYATMPAKLNLSGRYQDILGYLIDLEKLNYYLNITHIALNSEGSRSFSSKTRINPIPLEPLRDAGEDKAERLIRVTIDAVSYWRPDVPDQNEQLVESQN